MASSSISEHSKLLHNQQQPKSTENLLEEDTINIDFLPGGLSVFKAAIFIIAQVAGSGILALPKAVAGTGWTGIGLMVILGLLAMYCGIILGKCWNIVHAKHKIPAHTRDPYPLIGYHSSGKAGKYIVEVCILLTLIGSSVVYLIISSKQVSDILEVSLGIFDTPRTEFRMWILICGGVLIPCTWFASPKEMWLIAYGASLCSIATCILIIIKSSMHLYSYGMADTKDFENISVKSFFSAFGTIAFGYGGGVLLPTLQSDMKHPSKFIYAAFLGYFGILLLYLPCSILPYAVKGTKVDNNILDTLNGLPGVGHDMVKIAEILMTFHLLFAIVILSNPTTQLLEEKFNIPHEFGLRRIMVRSAVGLLVIGIAELFPNFGPILSLIGASTVTMLSFVLPSIFYLKLQEKQSIPLHQYVFHIEIIFISISFGCCGTYSAITGLSNPFKS